jgi:Domain of unknown function (DUF397)
MKSIPAVWRKSTSSESNGCVEVAFVGDQVAIRDSKDRSGPVLTFSPTEWEAFLAGVRHGEFDAPARPARPSIG